MLESPAGALDALLQVPPDPSAQCVLAHGAGAGMQHATMQAIAAAFAEAGVSTLRFNFPYLMAGKRRVDSKAVAVDSIAAAAAHLQAASDLPLLLAGHSFGGRVASHAMAEHVVAAEGLICLSFPLHPPKRPGTERAAHLPDITQPVLFLSGTRDNLAHAELLTEVVAEMSEAQIHWLETANHSYTILKRTRSNPKTVFEEMTEEVHRFLAAIR